MTPGRPASRPKVPIVWIASVSKSGNTWVRYLLYNAIFGEAQRAGDPEAAIPHMDGVLTRLCEGTLRRTPHRGYALVKTHALPRDTGPGNMPWLMRRAVGAIYIHRNPKDVCLSQINHMRLTGKHAELSDTELAFAFLHGRLFWMEGTWFEHVRQWREIRRFPVLTLSYERIKASPAACLRQMLEFLDEPADSDAIRRAVERSDIRAMRAIEDADGRALGYRDASGDPARRFVNHGLSDQSLAHLGPAFVAAFHRQFDEPMKALGYLERTDERLAVGHQP